MTRTLTHVALTPAAFAPFGDVLDAAGTPDKSINQGRCDRFNDLATLEFADGRAGISVFHSQCVTLPVTVEMMERHPLGSQAFVPMSADPFLVIVAEDAAGVPAHPHAFLTAPGQGINVHRNVWHGVLTP
ncbi:MAG: ureidoglycolate lyase, partial [Pseudomonadota bacterium]